MTYPPCNYSENDICDMLQTLRLSQPTSTKESGPHIEDVCMQVAQPCQPLEPPSAQSGSKEPGAFYGCAYLQAMQQQLLSYGTSTGEYVEAVFTHRDLFLAYPQAHRDCARGYTDIAKVLDNREWRSDRDGDCEAASVFRHEARMLASSF
jgi:hypothetical protein